MEKIFQSSLNQSEDKNIELHVLSYLLKVSLPIKKGDPK